MLQEVNSLILLFSFYKTTVQSEKKKKKTTMWEPYNATNLLTHFDKFLPDLKNERSYFRIDTSLIYVLQLFSIFRVSTSIIL